MQFRLYGKVVARTKREVKKQDGSTYELYNMVIEEPGQYPSRFQVGSKDPSVFGASDGPFAIGKMVTATGFINGKEREYVSKEGKKSLMYSTWLTVKELLPTGDGSVPGASCLVPSAAAEEMADDIPF